jgi:hypothetical protein
MATDCLSTPSKERLEQSLMAYWDVRFRASLAGLSNFSFASRLLQGIKKLMENTNSLPFAPPGQAR